MAGWLRQLMQRKPKLSLCRGDTRANVRIESFNPETIKNDFNLLYEVMDKRDLQKNTFHIYNVDKAGISKGKLSSKYCQQKGQ